MSYYGKKYVPVAAFDPNSIVAINTAATLTAASRNKQYILNSPATYTVDLPQLSTLSIGDTLTFIHNHTSGSVTLAAYAGNTIQVLGASTTSLIVNPGETVTIENVSGVWYFINTTKFWTAAQGANDNTPASTAWVVNEFNKHRNILVNGNFDFFQRSTAGTIAAGENKYFADRWLTATVGSSVVSSRQAFTLGQTSVPGEPTYYHRSVVTSVAGAGNYSFLTQRIESVRTLTGKTATLSFWAKADATRNMAVEYIQYFGTGGSPSTQVTTIGVTTIALTTSWTKYTVTAAIPSISGKTLGSNDDNFLGLQFWYEAGSTYNARTNTLGNQSGTFEISQVQLEEGAVATQFEKRPMNVEFDMCRRYYERILYSLLGNANSSNNYVADNLICYPKRATPTVSVAIGGSLSANTGASSLAVLANNTIRAYVLSSAAGNVQYDNETIAIDAEL